MKGIRFYEEFKDSRKRRSAGNVFALEAEEIPGIYSPWAEPFGAAAIFDEPNSPVAGTGVSREWLRKRTKRISEARAREIHPALFDWLAYGD